MARLKQNREIDLSGGSTSIPVGELVDTYYLYGVAAANVTISVTGAPYKEGSTISFRFHGTANMAGFTLRLLGEDITYTTNEQFTTICTWHNGAWEVDTFPDFEQDDIINPDHITPGAVTSSKLASSLDLTGKTVANAVITSGTINNTVIGGITPAVGDFTVGTLASAIISGGTINNTIIGGVTPAVGSFTSVNASIGLTGNLTGNVTGDLTGTAGKATVLETARTIAGQSFDGSGNINIAPENLNGVTSIAADLELLSGAAVAGVVAADILATNGIGGILSVSGDNLVISPGKNLSVTGSIKEDTIIVTNGTTNLGVNDTYVFAHLTVDSVVNLIDPATCNGKKVWIYNSSDYSLLATASGVGDFIEYDFNSIKSQVYINSGKSILVASNGTNWEVIKHSGRFYSDSNGVRQGPLKVKMVSGNVLRALLDGVASNIAIPMTIGDLILSVELRIGTASGLASTINVGPDSNLTGAATIIDGFVKIEDLNAVAYSEGIGVEITNGLFTCSASGNILVASSVDVTATGLDASLIIKYI